MPTDAEITANYAEVQKQMKKQYRTILDRYGDGPIEPLAEIQTQATLGWGRIGRKNDPEPHRCCACGKLLCGDRAIRMGVHAHCEDY